MSRFKVHFLISAFLITPPFLILLGDILINHAQLIAFKIRSKSSHLVKWKLIQLFYSVVMTDFTHTFIPTLIIYTYIYAYKYTCTYKQYHTLCCIWVSATWQPYFDELTCIIFLVILINMRKKYPCFHSQIGIIWGVF